MVQSNRDLHVVLLPSELIEADLASRAVAVFDVLRATTSITQALTAGAAEVRLFESVEEAAAAAEKVRLIAGNIVLAGERHCLPAPGFDLGNSPSGFAPPVVSGKTILFATTNGTKALLAAAPAALVIAACLNNAQAAAEMLARSQAPVTLLCAGTDGRPAPEDIIGCGAVAWALTRLGSYRPTPQATSAIDLFTEADRSPAGLAAALAGTLGGMNVINAGLAGDVDFAAKLNTTRTIGVLDPTTRSLHKSLEPESHTSKGC